MKDQNNNNLIISKPTSERNIILVSETEIKSFIRQQLEIGQLFGKISSLIRASESNLIQITGFSKTTFFNSEINSFQYLSEYYKKKAPKKKVLYLGFPQNFSQPNFSYIYQLRGAKAFLSERAGEVAALILDPLFLIQKSVDYEQRINTLRTLCSGSDIPFILDERKTVARLHQKGLNFIFQFNADAVLLGENLSNGIALGAIAHSSIFFDEPFLPGTFAPKAEGLIACEKITKELLYRNHQFYIDWNNQGNALCNRINKALKKKYPGGLMNNYGSILWLNNYGSSRAQKRLTQRNILTGSENCFYFPPNLNEEEIKKIANRIIVELLKRKI